jgi:integrase
MYKMFDANDETVLTLENIRAWQRDRAKTCSANQQMKDLTTAKITLKVALKEKLISEDFIEELYKVKLEDCTVKAAKIIEPQDLAAFLEKAKGVLKEKEYLAVYLGHALMTRPTELLAIIVEDIDLVNKTVIVRGTKTGTSAAELPLNDTAVSLIKSYILSKQIVSGPLFGGVSYWWLWRVYRKMSNWFGITDKDITPHKARKNMVMKMLDENVNIKVIQKYGRWKNNSVMLKHYASATNTQLRDAGNIL